jgi:hypothetical protein
VSRLEHAVMTREAITEGLRLIFQGIDHLEKTFPHRAFTIDGRLVGDIGEVIAALEYDVVLDEVSRANHDAVTSDGLRNVQIKATFKDSLTFRTRPDYYLGFKLYPNGEHEEIFNGPGQIIFDRYVARKGVGVNLLSFPIAELRKLSEQVPENERIPKRKP